MKRIKVFMLVAAITTFIFAGTFAVSAAPTDLSSLKIYAVDATGTKTEVPIDFKSTVYSYDITIKNDAQTIELDYTTEDSTSTAQILNEQYNLKMDEGTNKTEIQVTAANRTTAKYTINTTKLTAAESENFSYDAQPATTATDDKDAVKVKVGKKTFKISKTIKGDVPKGFEKSKYKYKDKKYECIVKGDETHLVALYLYNSKTEGFYVYDETNDSFYELKNINVASRMYTIVHVDDVAKVLKNYEKEKLEIGDTTVKAWVLDEDEDLYLVYAMNWDEEVNLYCYDAREKVFQRYPISEDSFAQKEAAETAYTNLQTNRNHLAKKYNWLLKIAGALIIIIIILVFIIINMKIAKKSKKLENEDDNNDEDYDDDFEFIPDDAENQSDDTNNEDVEKTEDGDDESEEGHEVVLDENEEPSDENEEPSDTNEESSDDNEVKKSKKELRKEEKKRKKEEKKQRKLQEQEDDLLEDEEEPTKELVSKKIKTDRTYGDEPTFGSDRESSEGFYGGEVKNEDEVLIDITEDEPAGKSGMFDDPAETKEQLQEEADDNNVEESEDDLQETLKSMLPPEDDDDDDEDFEFIDIE